MDLAGWMIGINERICGACLHAFIASFAQFRLLDACMLMKTKQQVDFSNHVVRTGFNALPASLAKVFIQPNEFRLIVTCVSLCSIAMIHILPFNHGYIFGFARGVC